ncbi:Glycine oxidase [Anoxybacillus sp. P3H1B]|uniref:glycine oxidase ThiO n=1 Tax=unclassified Anoxybacillus TaxID=2639704 RepID=UPI000794855D|nr:MULTISPECIES: glycine oxidase ThiO [unclassified Anoxybacillus]KXG10040.1 Glycine oxidase [Anoxybacillus sp. P3H1B]OQM46487.1 glycine oxidase ThiO [Anoxybacillus sp. UARK-01]
MAHNHYDVAIIGGGVIGGSIAFQLAKRNVRTVVLEKERIASQASSAAAGMLGAQSEFASDSPLISLALKSRAMFGQVAEELKQLTGIDIGYVQKGMLKVAVTEEEQKSLQEHYEFWRKMGQPVQWLSASELASLEPNVNPTLKGVMYIAEDGQVSAPHLSLAFAKASMAYGAQWHEFTEVIDIKEQGGLYELRTNQGVIAADAVVVSGGAWSALFLEKTGLSLSIYPVKGECLLVKTEKPLIQATLFAKNGCYLVPKRGGRILIGATSTPHTFDQKVTVQGVTHLLEKAQELVPSIGGAELEKSWAGIRPQTKDGLPYIGKHPHYQNVWIASGHYRNGILLSPLTGVLIADLVEGKGSGELDITPFAVTRHHDAISTV